MDKDVRPSRFWRSGGGDRAPRLGAAELHATALSMRVARRALAGPLPIAFLHDPALDMLVSLYLAQPEPMVVAELTAETTVSHGVAVHWIEALKAEGLLAAAGEQVALSDRGLAAMEDMLTAVVASHRDTFGVTEQ